MKGLASFDPTFKISKQVISVETLYLPLPFFVGSCKSVTGFVLH
ncbi:hypothetical protein NTE_01889 [Candidatus Nitrososphaera evergladensis SR1]|uniref:Uncharacterized protein n=1 Tax=Candidatus Nitrososphaera evergladensis SR1 TaxID=1459636 RepID=A0A075MS04_9ARCH|nr:hypothetical protein NTE_01889 [Candidatus Nitrososphaera evergladensis SR1]